MKKQIKEYTHMFFYHNHITFFLAILASILTALFNLIVSWADAADHRPGFR